MTVYFRDGITRVELNDIVSWKSKLYGTRTGRVIKIVEYVKLNNKETRHISCETKHPRYDHYEVIGNIKRFWWARVEAEEKR